MLAIVRRLAAPLAALLALAGASFAASLDGTVDDAHVSHVAWQDRRPLCPVDRQSFTVKLYATAGDLAGVRVRFADGAGTWITASRTGARGPYDVWEATCPAASGDVVRYYFELADGGARRFCGPAGVTSAPPADSGWALDFATLSHAPFGATPVAGGVVFRVWAPSSNDAWVEGEFNGFAMTNPMTKVGDDFVARVPGAHAGQRYEYLFDGAVPNFDPRARIYEPIAGYTHSRIDDPDAYTWVSNDFRTPPLGQMVIYQLNVGTFCGLNDPEGPTAFPSGFADVAARVKHLAELGVNAVLLNPVTSSLNLTYAGYECITPWPPNAQYGTPSQLKLLIDTCHQQGIAVLCDIVWNHVPPGANYLWNYNGMQLYFADPPTQTPWGVQADFGVPQVADFYEQSALHWLEEFRVDGFRMDAVAYMAIGTNPAAGWSLMQRFNADLDRRWTDKPAIAEMFPVTPTVTNPFVSGGAGFDAQYNGGARFDFGNAAWGSRWGYTYSSYYLREGVTKPAALTAAHQAFNYLELHDNAWTPNYRFIKDLERTFGALDDTAATCMGLAMGGLLLGAGVPGILMGDEWLEDADWGTGITNRIDWSKRWANQRHWNWMHDLIRLRTHEPAFFADAPLQPTHLDYTNDVTSFMRTDDDGNVWFVVFNFGPTSFPFYQIGVPVAGAWGEVLNSKSANYGGNALANGTQTTVWESWDGMPQSLKLHLAPQSIVVLKAIRTTGVAPGALAGGARLDAVFPSPMREGASVAFTLAAAGRARVDVYDARGARVATLADGVRPAGAHVIAWRGSDDAGHRVAPGVYFVRLDAGARHETRKLVVLR